MAHVLIGFAEALPAPEVVFSLRAAGHRVSAFARRSDLPLARLPLGALHVLPAPEAGTGPATGALQRIMAGPDAPDVVLPLDDTGLWLTDAALGPDPRVAAATGPQARAALDKAIQVRAAAAAGLPVPATLTVTGPADLDRIEGFPVIVKPADAVSVQGNRIGKDDSFYLLDAGALPRARQALQKGGGPYLVQPLVHGIGEGIFGFAGPEGVTAWSAHRRVRMMNPHGSGSSACQSVTPDPELCRGIERFLAAIGWRGAFMVEFLRDRDGTPWFMELNGRMWGSLALARRQGLEYPAWNVALCTDPDFAPASVPHPAPGRIQRHLGREILHLLFTLRGPKSDFHRAAWPRFGQSLLGVLKPGLPRGFYNYDPAHRFYFLRDAIWTVKRSLKR